MPRIYSYYIVLVLLCLSGKAYGQLSGHLLKSYGEDGIATLELPTDEEAQIVGLAALKDGRNMVMAEVKQGGETWTLISRQYPFGQLDEDFGLGGWLWLDEFNQASEILALPDGGCLIWGQGKGSDDFDLMMVKLTSSGNVDANFGSEGKVLLDFNTNEYPRDIQVLPDGRIRCIGECYNWVIQSAELLVAGLMPDGTMDPTFGFGGTRRIKINGALRWTDLKVKSPENLWISGIAREKQKEAPMVVCLDENGLADYRFAEKGIWVGQTGFDRIHRLQLDFDQKNIWLAASTKTLVDPQYDYDVFRLSKDGRQDTILRNAYSGQYGHDILEAFWIQDDEKLCIAGRSGRMAEVVRMLPNGTLDKGYGAQGRCLLPVGNRRLILDRTQEGNIVVWGQNQQEVSGVRIQGDPELEAYKDKLAAPVEVNLDFPFISVALSKQAGIWEVEFNHATWQFAWGHAQLIHCFQEGRFVASRQLSNQKQVASEGVYRLGE
ncbi:MAG: hypothetical protein AAGI38_03810 [Bacteroidota bacterium]